MNSQEVSRLLLSLWQDLHDIDVLWQVAIIAVALVAAWWMNRLIEPKIREASDTLQEVALAGLQRLQFPLTALIIVLIGRSALKHWHGVSLLDVAVPLLTSLAIVRAIVYALRRTFSPSGWLRNSERLIAWVVWVGFAVYITGLLPELRAFLDGIGFEIGNHRISLLLIIKAVLVVGITLLCALWLGSTVESRLMGAQKLDLNLRVVLAKLTRALLAVIALLIALPAVGLDLTLLSVFGGALGVGLGFGLQKIASNYVSGFIILMDRSVSLGDMVTVDKFSGQISKMTARYVVLRGLDGTETLVPNETLVTTPVVNNTYSDPSVATALTVSIDYSADPDAALKIMEDAAKRQGRVMRAPAPSATVKQLGERAIELELGFWIEDPQLGVGPLRSEMLRDILRGFRAAGIAFPPPTRDAKPAPMPPPAT